MKKRKFWVYKHINGKVIVKKYFDEGQVDDFMASPFVKDFDLIRARSKKEAVNIFKNLIEMVG